MSETNVLTTFSVSGGCGCKIPPAVLSQILSRSADGDSCCPKELLVGHDSRDDAAALDIGDGRAILSTTDFFAPVVDDPDAFGRIAATNALSDIYAMGGRPLMAIAILGWPTAKISPHVASRVLSGGRAKCSEAAIPLCGGHSINTLEPIFGLAVTGTVSIPHLKRNDTAVPGALLYLTKPLGVGIIAAAMRAPAKAEPSTPPSQDVSSQTSDVALSPSYFEGAVRSMTKLNDFGALVAETLTDDVCAITDVTGFGFLGHLLEMCQKDGIAARVSAANVPILPGVKECVDLGHVPGGVARNWDSYGSQVSPMNDEYLRKVFCDPQTSGGLLVAIKPQGAASLESLSETSGTPVFRIGTFVEASKAEGYKVWVE